MFAMGEKVSEKIYSILVKTFKIEFDLSQDCLVKIAFEARKIFELTYRKTPQTCPGIILIQNFFYADLVPGTRCKNLHKWTTP